MNYSYLKFYSVEKVAGIVKSIMTSLSRHFLTFVLIVNLFSILVGPSFSSANPPHKSEIETGRATEAKPNDPKPDPDQPTLDDMNLMMAQPKEPPPKDLDKTYYYPFRQSLAPRFGAVFSTDRDHRWSYLLGFSYLWPRYASPQAELGADIYAGQGGFLHFGVKTIYFERNYFRPFWVWGLSHQVIPEDRLTTFANIDNYLGRLSVGMEDVVDYPTSVRLELELLLGLKRQLVVLGFGYSWAW